MINNSLSFEVAKRNSLALKFIVLVVIILSITMSTASYINYQHQKLQLNKQLVSKGEMLGNFVSLVSPDAILEYDLVLLERYMKEIANREDVLYAAVILPNGNGLAGYFDPQVSATLKKHNDEFSITDKVSQIDELPNTLTLSFPVTVDGELLGIIHVGLTTERIDSAAKAVFLRNMYQTLAIIIALSLGIFYVFKRRVLNPVTQLMTAVKSISDGKFDHQIGASNKDELGVLARGFDTMSAYLQLSYEKLQEKNQELEAATKAKSYFLANMSHEIRTPLTAVIGFSESLLDSELSNANRQAAINTIIRNGNYLQKIINDILDISKIEADKLEVEIRETSIFEIFHDVCELVSLQAKEKGLEFNTNYEYPIPAVIYTDALRLKQILINLCSNAVKFTEHGSIYVDVSYSRMHSQLVVSIADTGIGLTEDQLERIFKPFTQADSSTTRKFGGTGLGLTLTRQLTEMLGGSITVKSEFGKGSRFTFTIATGQVNAQNMVYATSEIVKKAVPVDVDARKIKGTVLVVDDNADNQRLIKFFLSNTQLAISSVFNGMEAIKEVEKRHFDMILMDMHMPVLNGAEAINKIRKKGYDGPIISISADDLPQTEEISRQAGCCEILSKPIDKKKLLSYLYYHLVKSSEAEKSVNLKYRGRVLLAEDTPDNQRLVQLMFEKWGVTLTVVEDGRQAVEAALANNYDLILMDMQMPIMGGIEATKEIIAAGCKTPIVALTANALKHDRETYEKIGCSGFIAKPIKRNVFEKVLAKFLHQEQMAIQDDSLKIVRRNSLPEEDLETPDNIETQKSLQDFVMNSCQLVSQPVSDQPQSASEHQPSSNEPGYESNELRSLGDALNQLAKVMDHPLVKQFVRQTAHTINGHSQSSNSSDPIYSTVLRDEPDMADMVRQYVSSLEKTYKELNEAVAERQWDKVTRLVHDLKGTGGAFGFPQLSSLAKDLDELLKSRKYGEAEKLFNNLNTTYERILAARF